MIAGSALVRFLCSSGGMITVLLPLTLWTLARPRSRASRMVLAGGVILYTLLCCYPLAHGLASWLARSYQPLTRAQVPPGKVAIVLLGSGSYTQTDWQGGQYSVLDFTGAERTLEAARVFRLFDDAVVISSGGRVIASDPDETAGRVMREALLTLGIPDQRIVVEEQSRTTRDEATIVKTMLPALGVEHVVLVTSAVHMRRAEGVFRSVGIPVIPAVARDATHVAIVGWLSWLPSADGLDESETVAHEMLGLAYYWLRGWQWGAVSSD